MSAGYAIGERLADRRADTRGLCAIVTTAGVLLAAVPFAGNPFLNLSVKALGALAVGGFLGSLAAVLALVAVPVLLLGTVAPYANRLAVGRVAETGTVTGRLGRATPARRRPSLKSRTAGTCGIVARRLHALASVIGVSSCGGTLAYDGSNSCMRTALHSGSASRHRATPR